MIGLLGKKVGMTQIFDGEGHQVPVTVVEVGPCYVTELRTKEKDGYNAVQLGFDGTQEKKLTKAENGHLKKAGVAPVRYVREIRTEELEGLKAGVALNVDNFEVGDYVDVEGVSIGKGFQGAIKRHHFKGSASMGHGDMHQRRVGSIGASAYPSRVVKGMRMAGHMGDDNVTIQNLKVVKVDAENHLLAIQGAVPGCEGGYLVVRQALKRGTSRKWKVQGASKAASKEQPAANEEKK